MKVLSRTIILHSEVRTIVVRACSVLMISLLFTGCAPEKESPYSVKSGLFEQTLFEKGELEAISAATLLPPRVSYSSQLKITWLAEHGSMVKAGDTVALFDPSSIEKNILSLQEEFEAAQASRNKLEISMETAKNEAMAQMRSEEASYNLKKLEMERVRFEPEKKQRVSALQFQQATIQLEKTRRKLANQPVLNRYDMISSDIQLAQRRRNIEKAEQDRNLLMLIAPSDGLLQIGENPSSGTTTYKVGDNTYSNYPVVIIPDVSRMKVKTSVREVDITKVQVGMDVRVRLDALPSVFFKGVVTDISRVCLADAEGTKSFAVVVELTDRDERLKPGMTVHCEYVCYRSEKDLFVPNSCLLRTDTASYLFARRGRRIKRIEVTAVASNNHNTVVKGDVKEGVQLVRVEEALVL